MQDLIQHKNHGRLFNHPGSPLHHPSLQSPLLGGDLNPLPFFYKCFQIILQICEVGGGSTFAGNFVFILYGPHPEIKSICRQGHSSYIIKIYKWEPRRICGINFIALSPIIPSFPSSFPFLPFSLLPSQQLNYHYLLSVLTFLHFPTPGILYPGKLWPSCTLSVARARTYEGTPFPISPSPHYFHFPFTWQSPYPHRSLLPSHPPFFYLIPHLQLHLLFIYFIYSPVLSCRSWLSSDKVFHQTGTRAEKPGHG